jgi:ferric-dicitrate binding protein FerR (iron transport regulator)
VKSNKLTIEVLGTSFNVAAYSDETTIKTTLISGSVRVSNSNKSVNLRPGEQAQLINSGELLIKQDVNLDAVVSWKDGLFTFDRADVHDVMRQLARWYDLDIKYDGTVQPRLFGGGMQRDLNLSQVVEILNKNGFHLKIEGRTITVLP